MTPSVARRTWPNRSGRNRTTNTPVVKENRPTLRAARRPSRWTVPRAHRGLSGLAGHPGGSALCGPAGTLVRPAQPQSGGSGTTSGQPGLHRNPRLHPGHPPRPDLGWRRRGCTGAWGTACTGSWTWPLGWTKSACTRAPPPPPVRAVTPGVLLALRQNTTVKTGVAIRRRKGDRNPAYSETRLALTQQAAAKRRPPRCRCSETEDGALCGRPNPSRSSHSSGIVQGKEHLPSKPFVNP